MQKVQFMFIVSLIFAIIVTIFALTNANPVEINLFFYKFVASQALVIFISAALGAVIVTSLGVVRYIKLISQIRSLRKANEELTTKLNSGIEEIELVKLQEPAVETEEKGLEADSEMKEQE